VPRRASRPIAPVVATLAALIMVAAGLGPLVGRASASLRPREFVSHTYVVNSTADTADADVGSARCADGRGKCTLRGAIMQANFHPGSDVIRIPAGTFRLTRAGDDDQAVLGDLDITDSVTLEGAGSTKTIIDGNGAQTQDRVLQVLATAVDTTLTGLTIRGGRRLATFGAGGGLLWDGGGGQLTLSHIVVSGNKAYYGGGLDLRYSSVAADRIRLDHVTVEDNVATAAGGGFSAALGPGGSFLLNDSRIRANKAYEGGGLYLQGPTNPYDAQSIRVQGTVIAANHAGLSAGLENRAGTPAVPVRISTTSFHANIATNYGGGIGNYGDLALSRSTAEANTAVKGGALYDYEGGLATLTNDTLSADTASQLGGGVYVEYFIHGLADVALTSTTLSRNSAPDGGGVFVDPGAHASLTNTVIAKGSSGPNCSAALGGLTNLSDDNSCGFGAGDGIVDLGLGTIGPRGGVTRTRVPLPGSPAVDAGTGAGAPVTDQRGVTRPMGGDVDIGAVEVCPNKPAAPTGLVTSTKPRGPRVTLDWKNIACIETFSVHVRLGSRSGKVVQSAKGLLASRLRTKKLVNGHTYYWRVTAVADRGTTASTWHHVTVK